MTGRGDKQVFPLDNDGNPLAWADPKGVLSYVDAWNGYYSDRAEAIAEVPRWTASPDERVLAYGEGLVDEDEANKRRGVNVLHNPRDLYVSAVDAVMAYAQAQSVELPEDQADQFWTSLMERVADE